VLKGGSGSDVILGALGGDIINIGGSGEGNDTILADLGRVQIDFCTAARCRPPASAAVAAATTPSTWAAAATC
jgi:hypothetical protein